MVSFLICVIQRNVKTRTCVFPIKPQKNRKRVCIFYPKGTGGWKRVCVFLCFLAFPKTTKFFAFFEARQRCAVEFL